MKEFHKLSERQRNIVHFIESYLEQHGFPPTIRQIGEVRRGLIRLRWSTIT